jgi:hypothetical protein
VECGGEELGRFGGIGKIVLFGLTSIAGQLNNDDGKWGYGRRELQQHLGLHMIPKEAKN